MSEPERLTPEQLASLAELVAQNNEERFQRSTCNAATELAEHVPALLAEISHLTRERDDARAFLRQAHDDNWTPSGLDKLNTWARQEHLKEAHQPEELPEQIDAVIFHFQGLAKKLKDERDQAYLGIVNLQQACEAMRLERDALRTSTQATPGTPGHEQGPA